MAWAQQKTETNSSVPDVLVAIPNRSGRWSIEFTERTYLPLKTQGTDKFRRRFLICRMASISAARNLLVESALSGGDDYIFFIDSDVVLKDPVQAIEILLQCDADIVSGLYRRKNIKGFQPCMFNKVDAPSEDVDGPTWGISAQYSPITEWTGNWINADVVGMGCCLVDTDVFRDVDPPWFEWTDPHSVSEDFAFCEKARERGHEIKVMTDVKATHIGTLKVKPDGEISTLEI